MMRNFNQDEAPEYNERSDSSTGLQGSMQPRSQVNAAIQGTVARGTNGIAGGNPYASPLNHTTQYKPYQRPQAPAPAPQTPKPNASARAGQGANPYAVNYKAPQPGAPGQPQSPQGQNPYGAVFAALQRKRQAQGMPQMSGQFTAQAQGMPERSGPFTAQAQRMPEKSGQFTAQNMSTGVDNKNVPYQSVPNPGANIPEPEGGYGRLVQKHPWDRGVIMDGKGNVLGWGPDRPGAGRGAVDNIPEEERAKYYSNYGKQFTLDDYKDQYTGPGGQFAASDGNSQMLSHSSVLTGPGDATVAQKRVGAGIPRNNDPGPSDPTVPPTLPPSGNPPGTGSGGGGGNTGGGRNRSPRAPNPPANPNPPGNTNPPTTNINPPSPPTEQPPGGLPPLGRPGGGGGNTPQGRPNYEPPNFEDMWRDMAQSGLGGYGADQINRWATDMEKRTQLGDGPDVGDPNRHLQGKNPEDYLEFIKKRGDQFEKPQWNETPGYQGGNGYLDSLQQAMRKKLGSNMNDYSRRMRAEGALTGAQNGGGFMTSMSKGLGDLTMNSNEAMLNKMFDASEGEQGRQLQDVMSQRSSRDSRYGADAGLLGQKYGADSDLIGRMNGDDASARASMYGADRNLQGSIYGTKAGFNSDRYRDSMNTWKDLYKTSSDTMADVFRTKAGIFGDQLDFDKNSVNAAMARYLGQMNLFGDMFQGASDYSIQDLFRGGLDPSDWFVQ